MEDLAAIAPAPKKRRVYTSKRGKDSITEITMLAFDPSAHPRDDTQRTVCVLVTSTNTL